MLVDHFYASAELKLSSNTTTVEDLFSKMRGKKSASSKIREVNKYLEHFFLDNFAFLCNLYVRMDEIDILD